MKTELDMVNTLLASVSNAPVQSLENNISPAVANARRILNNSRQTILVKGWFCNTDTITIIPNSLGECVLPNDIIKATPKTKNVVDRGNKLYNRENNSYYFSSSQEVTLLLDLPYTGISFELLDYIESDALYRFFRDYDGDKDMTAFYLNDSMDKRAVALAADYRDRKDNGAAFTNIRIRYGEQ